MNWSIPWSTRESQAQPQQAEAQEEYFGSGESKHLIGTPSINIKGDQVLTFPDIPGVEGVVNLNLTVGAVADAMTAAFGPEFWTKITDIVVGPLPGKFGESRSVDPHTIYINPDAMVDSVHAAVVNESEKSVAESGEQGLQITPDIERTIRIEVAKDIWETLGHERTHDLDFQEVEKQIQETGIGSVHDVPEQHGEQAGQEARQRFRMNL